MVDVKHTDVSRLSQQRAKIKMDPGFRRDDDAGGFRRNDDTEDFRRNDDTEDFRRNDDTEDFRRNDDTERFRSDDDTEASASITTLCITNPQMRG